MRFMALLNQFGMYACNTFDNLGISKLLSPVTRKHWCGHQRGAQIDFVCLSRSLESKCYSANGKRYGNSDHYPVPCSILGRRVKLRRAVNRVSTTGWRPVNDEQMCNFRRLVLQESGLQGTSSDLANLPTLQNVTDAAERAAAKIKYSTRRTRAQGANRKPDELIEAEKVAKSSHPGPERRAARAREKKLRRQWKSKHAEIGYSKASRNIPNKMLFDGRLTANRDDWKQGVRSHCLSKYYDCNRTVAKQRGLVTMLRACQKAVIRDGWRTPVLTFAIVLQARAMLQSNKVSGGKDAIVYEMIQSLPLCVVAVFWRMFDARFQGETWEDNESWRWIILIFLQKVRDPRTLTDFRGICLMSAVSKWYMCSVVSLAKAQPVPASWNNLGIFAYREGLACVDVLLPLNLLLEAGFEWRNVASVCVASGDVLTAFDSLSVDQACVDMISSGLHPQLVAAIAQENCELQIEPMFPECADVQHLPFNKAIRQGGIESPFCWNRSMSQALAALVPSWKARGLGIILDNGFCASHAVWADNFYLMSTSPESLQVMIRELSAALLSRGLRWKPSSLEVMFTDYNQHNPVYAHDEDGEYTFEVVNELKALGALLCKEGTSPRAVVHRLAAATKAFWANANVLLDKSLSLPARFREFTVRVQSVALYSAECWPMCQATLQRLAAWESGLLRRIVGIKKKPSETWVGYHKRAARTSILIYEICREALLRHCIGARPQSCRKCQEYE